MVLLNHLCFMIMAFGSVFHTAGATWYRGGSRYPRPTTRPLAQNHRADDQESTLRSSYVVVQHAASRRKTLLYSPSFYNDEKYAQESDEPEEADQAYMEYENDDDDNSYEQDYDTANYDDANQFYPPPPLPPHSHYPTQYYIFADREENIDNSVKPNNSVDFEPQLRDRWTLNRHRNVINDMTVYQEEHNYYSHNSDDYW